MRSVLAVAALLVLAAGLWWIGRGEDSVDPAAGHATRLEAAPDPTPASLVDPSAPAELDAVAERPADRVEVPSPRSEASEGQAPVGSARLFGRLLFEDGAPAVGVDLKLRGFQGNSQRVAEHGLPDDWNDLQATTDDDGGFELRFDPPRAFQFLLDAHVDGWAPVAWRSSQIEPEAERDLGDTALVRGGSILVRIERPDGTPAGTDWRVHAAAADGIWHGSWGGTLDAGRDQARRTGTYDPARGAWLVTDMPPGPVEVSAYTRIANWIELPGVEVVAGTTVECTIPYEGPDNSRRITVITFSAPIYPVSPAPENVMLTGGPLTEPLPSARRFGSQSYDFPDLEPGLYSVVVDDPNFERFERTGVSPGTQVDAVLRGASAVRVEVVDRDSGEPVEAWSLNLRCENVNFGPTEFALVAVGAEPPADGVFDSLLPLDYTLSLEAPGYALASRAVPALARGEERRVRFELSQRGSVAGVLRREDGRSVDDIEVELYPGTIEEGFGGWWGIWGEDQRERNLLGRARTDARGGFRIQTSAGGPLILRAAVGVGRHALVAFEHEAGTDRAGVELVVSRGVTLVGRVLAPPGESFDGLILRAGLSAALFNLDPSMWYLGIDPFLETELSASGEFRLGPLGVEPLIVVLHRAQDGTRLYEDRIEPSAAGEHRFEIDLVEVWPGPVGLQVLVGGEPLTEGHATLEYRTEVGPWQRAGRGRLDAFGRLELLGPAGLYRARIDSDRFGGWSWSTPGEQVIDPSIDGDWRIAVPVARGDLTVVDGATGQPLADTALLVLRAREAGPVASRRVVTDGDGRLSLEQPAGDLWLRRGADAPSVLNPADLVDLPRLTWTAAGPTTAVVELP